MTLMAVPKAASTPCSNFKYRFLYGRSKAIVRRQLFGLIKLLEKRCRKRFLAVRQRLLALGLQRPIAHTSSISSPATALASATESTKIAIFTDVPLRSRNSSSVADWNLSAMCWQTRLRSAFRGNFVVPRSNQHLTNGILSPLLPHLFETNFPSTIHSYSSSTLTLFSISEETSIFRFVSLKCQVVMRVDLKARPHKVSTR